MAGKNIPYFPSLSSRSVDPDASNAAKIFQPAFIWPRISDEDKPAYDILGSSVEFVGNVWLR